jgi:hypothetical protein
LKFAAETTAEATAELFVICGRNYSQQLENLRPKPRLNYSYFTAETMAKQFAAETMAEQFVICGRNYG